MPFPQAISMTAWLDKKKHIMVDRGYDTNKLLDMLEEKQVHAVIPVTSDGAFIRPWRCGFFIKKLPAGRRAVTGLPAEIITRWQSGRLESVTDCPILR